jgi:dihydrofolate synthase/folylpolyglutamate synthase
VQEVMAGWSFQVGGGLVLAGRDLQLIDPRIVGDKLRVSVQARYNLFDDFTLAIPALYEAANLAVALAAFEIVRDEQELQMDEKQILREALKNLTYPGRMQTLAQSPFTVLDGAIAHLSARSVLDSLTQAGRLQKPVAAIVAVPADKDWKGVLWELSSSCDYLILTGVKNPRLKFPGQEAVEFARTAFPASTVIEEAANVTEARARLANLDRPPATILIMGTQSLLADTLRDYNFNLEQI